MIIKRTAPKKSLKNGMSLVELTVVMAAFLLGLAVIMIGASSVKAGAAEPATQPKGKKPAPKESTMPALIAGDPAEAVIHWVAV